MGGASNALTRDDTKVNEWLNTARHTLKDYGSLVISAGLFLVTTARLMSAAHGDLGTALGILQHSDTARLLVGAGVWLAPRSLLIVGLAAYITGRLKWLPGLALLLLMTFTVPALFLIPLPLVLLLKRELNHFRLPHEGRRIMDIIAAIGFGTLMLAMMFFTDIMWLPIEDVTMRDADGTTTEVVGYVLAADERQVAILEHSPRRIIVRAATVTTRTVCGIEEYPDWAVWLFRPLAWSVAYHSDDPPNYPPCD